MKKYLFYILIFVALVGLFSPAGKAQAAGTETGTCTSVNIISNEAPVPVVNLINPDQYVTQGVCIGKVTIEGGGTWTRQTPTPGSPINIPANGSGVEKTTKPEPSEFDKWATEESCGIIGTSSVAGCIKAVFYYVLYTPSALLLMISAKFFNALIFIALDSTMISGSDFVSSAWAIVRDLSNLFFILILLYIAIQIILGMAGHGAKQMIAKVIIIALLINFSMFFTEVIIDTSNMLALVFYNKLQVQYKNASGAMVDSPDTPTTPGEKNLSGKMYSSFDPTSKLDASFWEKTKAVPPSPASNHIPVGTMVGIILIASAIMLFAAYAFFISGIAFMARLIELWILIIFSPFAFMSSTVPLFSGIDYIGWDSWFKRLLKVAFMATIFMFFMYLIFLLLSSPSLFSKFTPNANQAWYQTLLYVLIPAMVICVLLLKATEFAKKGSGVIGETLMTGAKMVGGLALGAATGGVALGLTKTLGAGAMSVANNDELKRKAAGGEGISAKEQASAQRKLALANSMAKSSFDVRQTGIGKFAAKQSGMDFNKGTSMFGVGTERFKGGEKDRIKHKAEKDIEKKKTYQMSDAVARKQDDRAEDYINDKKGAQEKLQKTDKANNENWEKELAAALSANKFSSNPVDEKTFTARYEADHPKPPALFNEKKFEKEFKEAYEKGDRSALASFGINKGNDFKEGSVQTSKEINKDRGKAYDVSLRKQTENDEAKGAVKTFFNDFTQGSKQMLTTKAGLATTAAAGAYTGGLGAVGAVVVGGLAHAIKGAVGINKAEKAEIRAGVIKGETKEKKFLDLAKELAKEGEKSAAATTHPTQATRPTPPPPPAAAATATRPTPAAGGAHAPTHPS